MNLYSRGLDHGELKRLTTSKWTLFVGFSTRYRTWILILCFLLSFVLGFGLSAYFYGQVIDDANRKIVVLSRQNESMQKALDDILKESLHAQWIQDQVEEAYHPNRSRSKEKDGNDKSRDAEHRSAP